MFIYVYVFVPKCVCRCPWLSEEGLDPCKLKLQTVGSLPMDTGNQTQVLRYSRTSF